MLIHRMYVHIRKSADSFLLIVKFGTHAKHN